MNFNIVNNKLGELDKNRKYISVITAGNAIRDLVSNLENKDYTYTHIPVDIEVDSKIDTYNIFLIHEKDKYNEMIQEVKEKFTTHDFDSFLEPSNNYVQLGIYKDTGMKFYKYKISFDQTEDPIQDNQIVSCIVDPKYTYINDVMNRWFRFENTLDVHKSDDIYQFIYSISHKEEKNKSFIKKILKK